MDLHLVRRMDALVNEMNDLRAIDLRSGPDPTNYEREAIIRALIVIAGAAIIVAVVFGTTARLLKG